MVVIKAYKQNRFQVTKKKSGQECKSVVSRWKEKFRCEKQLK